MRFGSASEVIAGYRPGMHVYVSGASVEPLALHAVLLADPDRAAGIEFLSSLVPGVNRFDYASLHRDTRLTILLLPEAMRASFDAGRIRALPIPYSAFAAYLAGLPIDIAIVQTSLPDGQGNCALGPCADFAPVVWQQAKFRVAFMNDQLPCPPGAWQVRASDIDLAVECSHPLISLAPAPAGPELQALARHAAAWVPEGATLQFGLGGAPAAIAGQLTGHRNLRIHSGMIGDEVMALAQAGALQAEGHRTGVAIGSAAFYAWASEDRRFRYVPTPQTHGAGTLAALDGFIAINSALEVDLFGQANVEWRGGRLAGGVGGAADFLRGARASKGGLAMIALPATAKGNARIVARLAAPSVSIARLGYRPCGHRIWQCADP
jgi:acyl-CoA hydrolase